VSGGGAPKIKRNRTASERAHLSEFTSSVKLIGKQTNSSEKVHLHLIPTRHPTMNARLSAALLLVSNGRVIGGATAVAVTPPENSSRHAARLLTCRLLSKIDRHRNDEPLVLRSCFDGFCFDATRWYL
jgi:hypothetical protein